MKGILILICLITLLNISFTKKKEKTFCNPIDLNENSKNGYNNKMI
jgi:hypothetical protein